MWLWVLSELLQHCEERYAHEHPETLSGREERGWTVGWEGHGKHLIYSGPAIQASNPCILYINFARETVFSEHAGCMLDVGFLRYVRCTAVIFCSG